MRQRTTIAGVLASSLLLFSCGGDAEQQAAGVEVEESGIEELEVDTDEGDEPVDVGASAADAEEPASDLDDAVSASTASADATSDGTAVEPTAERLADPCADHAGREMDTFIDLVAPVDEQTVSGDVEVVGCSNVYEATVAWTLLDGDGNILDEGFATAECGTGCVGEFRDTISLEAASDQPAAYLQVFSPNASDEGPAQLQLTEVLLLVG